jgi:glycerol uptake facilitator-like aquaporin
MREESEKESAMVRNPLLRIIIFEAIGTLILVYGILCSQYLPPLSEKVSNPFHDVFISLSLYLSIVICGPLTGGHFNMAVTTGVGNVKNSSMSKKQYWAFVVGQFIGAIIGAVLGKVLWDCEGAPFDSTIGWL